MFKKVLFFFKNYWRSHQNIIQNNGNIKVSPDDTIYERVIADFCGMEIYARFYRNGELDVIIEELPPQTDRLGRTDFEPDEFMPEADLFDLVMSKYLGTPVDNYDREFFRIKQVNDDMLKKLEYFFKHYWELRDSLVDSEIKQKLEEINHIRKNRI
jgi:hypothetical protein